jgi:predicted negative regulator of RcsB-dependent stress response
MSVTSDVGQSIQKEAKKTELGQWVVKNIKQILVVGALAIIGFIGYTFVQNQAAQKIASESDLVFNFTKEKVAPYLEGKSSAEVVVGDAEKFLSEIKHRELMVPTISEIFNYAQAKSEDGKLTRIYVQILPSLNQQGLSYYFMTYQLATIQENSQQYGDALAALEKLVNHPYKLEEKLYFDLGRLALKAGDKEKAKKNFNYVIEKFPDSEFVNQARAYQLMNNL